MSLTTSRSRYIPVAENAKLVRGALRAAFPGQKFSVRSKTYAGGASINVSWIDGPTEPQVQATTYLYAGTRFDDLQDLQIHHESLLSAEDGAEVVRFAADHVDTQRAISPAWEDELQDELAAFARELYDHNRRYSLSARDGRLATDIYEEYGSTLVHQLAYERSREESVA